MFGTFIVVPCAHSSHISLASSLCYSADSGGGGCSSSSSVGSDNLFTRETTTIGNYKYTPKLKWKYIDCAFGNIYLSAWFQASSHVLHRTCSFMYIRCMFIYGCDEIESMFFIQQTSRFFSFVFLNRIDCPLCCRVWHIVERNNDIVMFTRMKKCVHRHSVASVYVYCFHLFFREYLRVSTINFDGQ